MRTRTTDATSAFQPGSRVVIKFNPHHHDAVDIIAVVRQLDVGGGFMRCDLAYVEYIDPRDGETHTLPFTTRNLLAGDPAVFLAMAERHEAQALELRRLAIALRLAPEKQTTSKT
jgi:hypothetical protein